MKKILVLLMLFVIVVALFGCGQINADSEDKPLEPVLTEAKGIPVERADASPVNVIEIQDFDGERGVVFNRKGINNSKTAGKIATAILEQYQEEGLFIDYQLQLIEHDTAKGIWIVSFWASDEHIGPGPDLEIALLEENAQIVGMWLGE